MTNTLAPAATDAAARLAEMQARENKALAAVTTATTSWARKKKKNDTTRDRLAAEEQDLVDQVEIAQAAYVTEAGPERAAAVLGITVTAARNLANTNKASAPDQHDGEHDGEHHGGPS